MKIIVPRIVAPEHKISVVLKYTCNDFDKVAVVYQTIFLNNTA
jgi:hypothetical protein